MSVNQAEINTGKTALRWLAVAPAALGAWWCVSCLGLLAYSIPMQLCPVDQLFMNSCHAAWFPRVESVLIIIFSALSAVAVILAAVYVAPTHRRYVAWSAFFLGSALALFMGIIIPEVSALIAAISAGAVTLYLILHRMRRHHAIPPAL